MKECVGEIGVAPNDRDWTVAQHLVDVVERHLRTAIRSPYVDCLEFSVHAALDNPVTFRFSKYPACCGYFSSKIRA